MRNGSIERFNALKFGDKGFGVLDRDASVGGWDAWASAEGTGVGSECKNEVRR